MYRRAVGERVNALGRVQQHRHLHPQQNASETECCAGRRGDGGEGRAREGTRSRARCGEKLRALTSAPSCIFCFSVRGGKKPAGAGLSTTGGECLVPSRTHARGGGSGGGVRKQREGRGAPRLPWLPPPPSPPFPLAGRCILGATASTTAAPQLPTGGGGGVYPSVAVATIGSGWDLPLSIGSGWLLPVLRFASPDGVAFGI